MAGESGSSRTMDSGHSPHSMMEMRPRLSRACSASGNALMPCFHWMFTSLPKLNIIPLVCGKYSLVPFAACRKASSLDAPKDTPTVMFWFSALLALKAAESWWNGFQSEASLYQLKRVPTLLLLILK
eukprot:CAMPEP_0170086766 /NCGR_PEP_ID=MMETSP0019_2-20121128/21366_1 /TAXON_ID=98059 /ORGANISM="Dinobryon sp., Strain UTEXLB2267" /LENGTH=126 /DNA_ID=CAMNT_0010303989 /DNA_START=322 /DNA_END=702 /DNA_ORIENTATION=+